MSTIKIKASSKLTYIEARIIDREVLGHRFIGSHAEGAFNVCEFEDDVSVPPRPSFILMGAQKPANSTLAWVGSLQVEGDSANVQMYRAQPVATTKGNLSEQVARVQAAIGVGIDGLGGPETWSALESLHLEPDVLEQLGSAPLQLADARSERYIATLQENVKPYARALYFKAKEHGIKISIISGTRTFAEQDAEYAKGRTARGSIVTNLKGGESNHCYGIAFDVAVFRNGEYLKNLKDYLAVGVLGEELGLEWGGRWKRPVDGPHFQLRPTWANGLSQRAMAAKFREMLPTGYAWPTQSAMARSKAKPDLPTCCSS